MVVYFLYSGRKDIFLDFCLMTRLYFNLGMSFLLIVTSLLAPMHNLSNLDQVNCGKRWCVTGLYRRLKERQRKKEKD